jgi:hypothetical protein
MLSDVDIAVCFEAPNSLYDFCRADGPPLLDLALHPFRFSHDLFLMARSPDDRIQATIESIELEFDRRDLPVDYDLDEQERLAAFLRAESAGGGRKSIFFLQTRFDKSKFDLYGGIIDDFGLLASVSPFPVFYRPHPLEPRPELEVLLRARGARPLDPAIPTNAVLMSGRDDIVVAAISSAVLAEAVFLGMPHVHAIRGLPFPLRGFEKLCLPEALTRHAFVAVDSRLLTANVWRRIIRGDDTGIGPPHLVRQEISRAWNGRRGGGK